MACVLTPEGKQIRKFGTMTKDLLLSDWLSTFQVTHVAMGSTGVFWQPIYNLLEEEFTLWVVNARHVKNVPGRKTDVKDAEWHRRPPQPRLALTKFHTTPRPKGFAGIGALSTPVNSESRSGSQPNPESTGVGQHQTGLCGQRCNGSFWTGHAAGDGGWGGRP
jgi:hypothetical protein